MNRETLKKIRRWIVVQKYTFSRGYIWCQSILLGFIFASSIKVWLPQLPLVWLVIGAIILLYFIGWLDKKYRFLDEEQAYSVSRNPLLLSKFEEIKKGNGAVAQTGRARD